MINHVTFGVGHFDRAMSFYDPVLRTLGLSCVSGPLATLAPDKDEVMLAGFGKDRPFFWIVGEKPVSGLLHIAFGASSRSAVDAFYRAALKAGGTDNGAPGLRCNYHSHYYAAFIRDPEGHNIEAVCHSS